MPDSDKSAPLSFDRNALLVLLLACAVFFAWLGTRGLIDPDEGRFAEIGREMAAGDSWMVPHLNGIPHFQKPPLVYWFTALSMRLLGPTEWGARLPSAVAACGTVALAMLVAGLLFGPSARWKTGIILTTSFGFFVLARVITTDMLLTFWITAAAASLVLYVKRGSRLALAAFYTSIGLGFLTKGPMALLVPCSAALAWSFGRRRQSGPRVRMYWWIGLPVALAIGLSWFFALIHRFPALWEYFAGYELVQRFASNVHKRSEPFWFHAVSISGALLPWTFCLPGLFVRCWRRLRAGDPDAYLFIGWIVIPFIVLSMAKSKLPTYVLPLLPPMAILLGRWWERAAGRNSWKWSVSTVALLLGIGLAAVPFVVLRIEARYNADVQLSPWFAVAIGGALVLFVLSAVLAWRPRGIPYILPSLGGALGLVLVALVTHVDQLIHSSKESVRELVLAIAPHARDASVPVFVYGRSNSVEFYLKRYVSRAVKESDIVLPLTPEQDARIVEDPTAYTDSLESKPAFVLISDRRFKGAPALADWHVVGREGNDVLLASPAVKNPPSVTTN